MGEFINKTKGKMKQAVGELTGNAKLERAGQRDEARGEIQGGFNHLKRVVKGSVKDAKGALKSASK